jgi:plastocyanin
VVIGARPFFALLSILISVLPLAWTRPAQAATQIVSVQNFVFTPAADSIAAGDVVRWNWVGGIHTTTSGKVGSPNGLWDAPLDQSNTFFQRTFNTPGTFPYHCTFHGLGGMTGTITVVGNAAPVVQNPGTRNGEELQPFTVTVTATDADGNPLTMSDLGTKPVWSTFVDNGNRSCTISGTPAAGQRGTYHVTVRASDGLATGSTSFDIVIAKAPIVVDLTTSGFVPQSVNIVVGDRVRWVKGAGGTHTTTSGTPAGTPDGIWNAPLTAGSPEFIFTFNSPGAFPYYCANHTTDTGTVTVEALPTCIIAGADPLCAGVTGNVYTATVSPSAGTVAYSWSITGNGSIVGSTTGSSVSVSGGAAGSFMLTLNGTRNTIAFQCTKTVTVNANPTCAISGPDPVSESAPGNLYTATVTPVGGTVTYSWSISGNGILVGSTTGSSASVTAGAAGSFTLSLNITRNGCTGTCQKIVTVSSAVAATILVQDLQFLSSTVQISAGQKVKWQWVNGIHTTTSGASSDLSQNPGVLWDATIDTLHQSFIRQFNTPGYYPYFCRVHELMGMRGVVLVGSTTAVGDRQDGGIRLLSSPNPFTSKVQLFVDLVRNDKVMVDIFDLNGRRILGLLVADLPAGHNGVVWGGWDDHHQPVAPGVYFARLQTGSGQVAVQKLFKTR